MDHVFLYQSSVPLSDKTPIIKEQQVEMINLMVNTSITNNTVDLIR